MSSFDGLYQCRLCLCGNGNLFHIFYLNDNTNYIAADLISDLLQFAVSRVDGYPPFVCYACYKKLAEFKIFKERCKESIASYDREYLQPECILGDTDIVEGDHRPIKLEEELGTRHVFANKQFSPSKGLKSGKAAEEESLVDLSKNHSEFQVFVGQVKEENEEERVNPSTEEITIEEGVPGKLKEEIERLNATQGAEDSLPGEDTVVKPSDTLEKPSSEEKVTADEETVTDGDGEVIKSDVLERPVRSPMGCYIREEYFKSSWENLLRESDEEPEDQIEVFNAPDDVSDAKQASKPPWKVMKRKTTGVNPLEKDFDDSEEELPSIPPPKVTERKTDYAFPLETVMTNYSTKPKPYFHREYPCDICGRIFNQNWVLKCHYRRHTNERPFACSVCDKRFYAKTELKRHAGVHSENRHKCEVCQLSFKHKATLRSHMLSFRHEAVRTRPLSEEVLPDTR